jgi:hypothetical protein
MDGSHFSFFKYVANRRYKPAARHPLSYFGGIGKRKILPDDSRMWLSFKTLQSTFSVLNQFTKDTSTRFLKVA